MGSSAFTLPPSPRTDALHAGRIVCALATGLVCLGLVMVYSSTASISAHYGSTLDLLQGPRRAATSPHAALLRQLRWVVLAAIAGIAAARVPLEWIRKACRPALIVTLLLLVAVLFFGPDRNRSKRWLIVGGMSIQPSEFLKITVLAWLAHHLADRERASSFRHRMPLISVLAPVGLGVVLVLVAPDLGTSLFIAAEAIVLLALAGVRPTRALPFIITALPLLVFYGYTRFGHVRKRLALFTSAPQDGTQIQESLVAIGSGGLSGRGLGEGVQKLGFIAESKTDFIFAVIGEELGFLGTTSVVLAFMAFVWYGRKVAWEGRILGPHAFYLAAGATFIVGFQALINIAVVTATAPTKGVSLPFISVGGSNLLMSAMCVGFIANVSRRTAMEKARDPWR